MKVKELIKRLKEYEKELGSNTSVSVEVGSELISEMTVKKGFTSDDKFFTLLIVISCIKSESDKNESQRSD